MNDVYGNSRRLGTLLRTALVGDDKVNAMTQGKIIPVASPVDVTMPFITFHRAQTAINSVKSGSGAFSTLWQIQVYTPEHPKGADIAESVARAIDGLRGGGIRSCRLTDWLESFDPQIPAFVQVLVFDVRPE